MLDKNQLLARGIIGDSVIHQVCSNFFHFLGCVVLDRCIHALASPLVVGLMASVCGGQGLTSVASPKVKCPDARMFRHTVGMQNQHLKGSGMASSERLDVRWANDDPNPKSIKRVKRQYEEEYMDAVRSAVNELPPEQKRARLLEMQLYGSQIPAVSAVAPYPGLFSGSWPACSSLLTNANRVTCRQLIYQCFASYELSTAVTLASR